MSLQWLRKWPLQNIRTCSALLRFLQIVSESIGSVDVLVLNGPAY